MRATAYTALFLVSWMAACSGGVSGGDGDPADAGAEPDAPPRPDADPLAPDADPDEVVDAGDGTGPDAAGLAGWHPSHLALGTIFEGGTGLDDFFADVAPGWPANGKRLDFAYIYLNGGGQMGEWPGKVSRLVSGAKKHGMTPVFVLYAMNGDADSAEAVFANMNSASYLGDYFDALVEAAKTARDTATDGKVGWVIEPDMLGYLQQQIAMNHGNDPAQIPAATHAVYDAGALVRGVDPDFPDTLTGLVGAINHTLRKHGGEQVFFGWQLNLWGAPGGGGKGICHATETLGATAGKAKIVEVARSLADFAARAGVRAAAAEFVSIDKYGLDGAGAAAADPNNPADSYWFWNADLWTNYLLFVKTLHEELDRPMVLWQIPVGHINVTHTASPTAYNASGTFPVLDNTFQRYEDSASSFFFGDSFTASGARLSYFGKNELGAAKVSVSGTTVTWGSHLPDAAEAGVVAILFGAGVGIATRGVPQPSGPLVDQPSDGYYWIHRVQQYYAAPLALP